MGGLTLFIKKNRWWIARPTQSTIQPRIHAYVPQSNEAPPPRDQRGEEKRACAEEEDTNDAALGPIPVDERADGDAVLVYFLGVRWVGGEWADGRGCLHPSI